MKYIIILMSLFVISNTWASDTVWVESDTTIWRNWMPLGDSVLVGDADGSQEIDMDDVVFLLEYIFGEGQSPMIYRSVDLYEYVHESYHVIISTDSTGEYKVEVFPHRRSTRFGQVSGQQWNDSLPIEELKILIDTGSTYWEHIDTLGTIDWKVIAQ
jgi:hypothetical protein